MLSAPATPGSALEATIRACLADRPALTEEVRRFLEATFGDASAATLKDVLADPASAERESLLDLIFFPDPPLQLALEPLLERYRPSPSDVAFLADRLKAQPPVARLGIGEGEAAMPVPMPAFAVNDFLNRLHLLWCPVDVLTTAIARLPAGPLSPAGDAEDGRRRLRVRMRNAAPRQTPTQVRFLCDFFERVPLDREGFVDQLDFMLVFMNEHEAAGNLYRALMDRKKFLFRHLEGARRAAQRAARSNMETLVMTGVRTAYFDVAVAERNMVLIDAIAWAVFGRTEALEGPVQSIDLGHHDGTFDPEALIRRLS